MYSKFNHVKIAGLGAVVPREEIRLEDELEYFDGDIGKARRMTKMVGIDRRRVAGPGVTVSDLCQQAAERLIADMGADKKTIDALLFVSQSPDYALPATACILQDKLGLPTSCAAFDVNQGCSGYVYGLWLAFSLIESGSCARVLLLEGDGNARYADLDNRVTAPVFGDGGSATLIERARDACPAWFALGSDGSGAEALMVPAGRARLPLPKTAAEYAAYCERLYDAQGTPWRLNRTYMDGAAVFDFTMSVVPKNIVETLAWAGKSAGDIDWFVPHQANRLIMRMLAEKTGFPLDKTLMDSFGKYGNCAGASIPIAFCDAFAGESCAIGSALLAGYGVGLSFASAVLELDRVYCSGVRDFSTPDRHPLPEDILRHWRQKIAGIRDNDKGEAR